ncbi:MAG: D-alanyl-D-alanine carboxypeptidase, partial [Actinomycetota bacterium]|nr:D-alanyl-D-alanine carboxypeptidase [Actinomycetota bacterium]
FMNPSFGGYAGVVYYDVQTKTLVIAYVTLGPISNAETNNAVPIGKEIASMLVPDRPPAI